MANASVGKSQEDTWEALPPMQSPRTQLGVATVNQTIYAIGGVETSPNGVSVNEAYDTATNTWITLKPMPTARYNFGIAVYHDKIYVFGGITDGPRINVTEVYDPSTDNWETKSPLPLNAPEIACANTVEDKIYVMGVKGENQSEVFNLAYDPTADTWEACSPPSTGVIGGMSAVIDEKIYVIGGAISENFDSSMNQVYNTETDTWTTAKTVPYWVSEAGCTATTGVKAPKRIYVLGGETTYVSGEHTFGNVTDRNIVYDPESDSWNVGASMPSVLRLFGVAVVNDQLYVVGGVKELLGEFADHIYRYTPAGLGSTAPPAPFYATPAGIALIAVITVIVVVGVWVFIIRSKKLSKSESQPRLTKRKLGSHKTDKNDSQST
jgi:N-acetylneuraminic acid mutarotase